MSRPIMTLTEAAECLGVPRSTLRTWAKGYEAHGTIADPVITCVTTSPRRADLPFIGLVEAHVLSAFRAKGVSLQRIRPALLRLSRELGVAHVLASGALYTDGANVLFDYAKTSDLGLGEELTEVSSGQRVFVKAIHDYLSRITFDDNEWPTQLRLVGFDDVGVFVDPLRSFGAPIFSNGTRVADVRDRALAGERVSMIAEDFGLQEEEVRAALLRAG